MFVADIGQGLVNSKAVLIVILHSYHLFSLRVLADSRPNDEGLLCKRFGGPA